MPDSLFSLIDNGGARDAARLLACDLETSVNWGQFQQLVEPWRETLRAIDSRYIAIHQPDVMRFLPALWATWQLGKTALLSASGFRELPELAGFAGSDAGREQGICCGMPSLQALDSQPADAALLLFTSGSSGAPELVAKTFGQLEDELLMLEQVWGAALTDSLVVSMVSHHHMYGLPFGLLWPLLRGTPFFTSTVHYSELLESIARCHRLTLVASPVQLQNLPDNLDFDLLRRRTAQLFSAGAALPAATAARCRQLFSRPVTEIYGSTETGAIAWRQQPGQDSWQCLPGITVAAAGDTGQLAVRSPAAGDGWQQMPDLAALHSDTTFELGGRTDRIVKVGGKRVSLTAIETALTTHALVREARAVLLVQRKGRIGIAVVLSAAGNRLLIDRGRAHLNRLLAAHIEQRTEPVAMPRYWRYLAEMPTNSQAKTTVDTLADLFLAERQSRWPDVVERQALEPGSHYQLTLRIPENLYYLGGHFPGNPVLPGVVQMHWAIHYGRELFSGLDDFLGLETIKFQHIIQPGAQLTLELQWQSARGRLQFSYRSAHARHSSGRVLFAPEAGHAD